MRADEKRQAANDYATPAHFCRIFQEDMQSLYLLAFLLTANHEHAEQCLLAGMEDALNERRVFKEWARSWTRRIVIKNTICLFAAPSDQSNKQPDSWAEADDESAASTTISFHSTCLVRPDCLCDDSSGAIFGAGVPVASGL